MPAGAALRPATGHRRIRLRCWWGLCLLHSHCGRWVQQTPIALSPFSLYPSSLLTLWIQHLGCLSPPCEQFLAHVPGLEGDVGRSIQAGLSPPSALCHTFPLHPRAQPAACLWVMLPYTSALLFPQLAATSTAGLECPWPLPPEQIGWEAK